MKSIACMKSIFSLVLLASASMASSQAERHDSKAAEPEGIVKAVSLDPDYTLDDNEATKAQPSNGGNVNAPAEKVQPSVAKDSITEPVEGGPSLPSNEVSPEGAASGAEVESSAISQGAESSSAVAVETTASDGEVSKGERIFIEGKGFSIVPPVGWFLRRDLPRTSLFLKAPVLSESEYPRNISVLKFSGPKVINEVSADQFSKYLVKNFPSASPEIDDYQLRNHQAIQMADGREGLLFYTDFSVRGKAMMQAHVLVSSETAHFLISFTDVAEHFENPQGDNEFLANAWASMISIELDSANPQPMESLRSTVIMVGLLVLLGGLVAYARHRAAGSIYRDYGAMEPGEAAEIDPQSRAVESEHAATDLSEADISEPVKTEHAQILKFRTKKAPEESLEWNLEEPGPKDADSKMDDEIPKDQWKVS